MEFTGSLFHAWAWWLMTVSMAVFGLLAIINAPWRGLVGNGRFNVWSGAIVGLMLLWLLRTQAVPGLEFHLLCTTAMTLAFGWSLGLLGAAVALAGTSLAGQSDWQNYAFNIFSLGFLPVSLSYASLLLVRAFLPRNFFVFIFINAFLTAGFVAVIDGYAATALLVYSGHYTLEWLEATLTPFFPVMFFPEAMLNGWIMTLLVVFRPQWVYSFRDEDYLR